MPQTPRTPRSAPKSPKSLTSSKSSALRPEPSVSSSLGTGRALILLQILSRLLTFGLNQALLRLASPEVFGTAAIQFDLVWSTILFLSREGIRNALLRTSPPEGDKPPTSASPYKTRSSTKSESIPSHTSSKSNSDESSSLRLAVYPLYLSLPISVVLVAIYLYSSPVEATSQRDFHISLILYVLSAYVELAIEPHYIRTLRGNSPNIRVRVQAEGGMAIVKALVTVSSIVYFERRRDGRALLGFALGQLAGAVWLAGRYALEYGARGLVWLGGSPNAKEGNEDTATLSLAIANTRQSFIKHLLTAADRIAVGRISPLQEQGGYAVAASYGSLIARIIFQPLEETLLLHFSSSLASPNTPYVLYTALHLSAYLLILLPAFVPPLLPAILPLLLPARYRNTSAPRTLETYLAVYIPLMSLNGILEAFHASSATSAQISNQVKWMFASSATFAALLYGIMRAGIGPMLGLSTEQALIFASCGAMIVRILYAYLHATAFFRRRGDGQMIQLKDLAPAWEVIGACLGAGAVLRNLSATRKWSYGWQGALELLGLGSAMGLSCLGLIWTKERRNPNFRAPTSAAPK